MTNSIYDQHDKAFNQVRAYVLMKDDQQIGTISFKYPRGGAGRLWCYFHVFGIEMARGYAGGYGYDKTSAAAQAAARNIKPLVADKYTTEEHAVKGNALLKAVVEAVTSNDSDDWHRLLDDAGFQVLRAI